MKSEYTAYIHTNGSIQVKRCVFGEDLIDVSSPFVMKHLGRIEAKSATEALKKFEIMIGIKED